MCRNGLKPQTHKIQLKIVDEVKSVRNQPSITDIYIQSKGNSRKQGNNKCGRYIGMH